MPKKSASSIARTIDQAMGREPADLVVKNVRLFDLVTVARGYGKTCPQPWLGTPAGTMSTASLPAKDPGQYGPMVVPNVAVDPALAGRLGLAIGPTRVIPGPPRLAPAVTNAPAGLGCCSATS